MYYTALIVRISNIVTTFPSETVLGQCPSRSVSEIGVGSARHRRHDDFIRSCTEDTCRFSLSLLRVSAIPLFPIDGQFLFSESFLQSYVLYYLVVLIEGRRKWVHNGTKNWRDPHSGWASSKRLRDVAADRFSLSM